MSVLMKGKHLLSLSDLSREEIEQIFDQTKALKLDVLVGPPHPILAGKTLAMIFEKPSTRTRVSFQVGMTQLGGQAIFLSPRDLQIGRGETIGDTARTISRYCDGIMARVFAHSTVVELAKYSRVPVINGLTDLEHPCQVLTDLYTVQEKKGRIAELTMAYFGDGGNNMAHSLLLGCARMGMNMRVVTPSGAKYQPNAEILAAAKKLAAKSGCEIVVTDDPGEGAKGVEVLYTDVWTSMGQEEESELRRKELAPFQVNQKIVDQAHQNVIVMHCLPAHRGEEITSDVLDGPQSVVFDQAENRLHVQKAIMALVM